jgi:hypothetical protein
MNSVKILFLAGAILFSSCNQTKQQDEDSPSTDTTNAKTETVPPSNSIAEADTAKLLGSWTRTDAPYEIKILELNGGGNMVAGYFNPKSINVAEPTSGQM